MPPPRVFALTRHLASLHWNVAVWREEARILARSGDKDTGEKETCWCAISLAAGHGGRALAMAQAICIDVASLARTVLGRSKIFDIRALDVDQAADSVVLRGSVDSFYHKQLAQEMIKTSLEGVEVINEIRVDYSRDRAADDCDWQW